MPKIIMRGRNVLKNARPQLELRSTQVGDAELAFLFQGIAENHAASNVPVRRHVGAALRVCGCSLLASLRPDCPSPLHATQH